MQEIQQSPLAHAPLWAGIALAGFGSLLSMVKAVMTPEGVSGGLVAAGGVAVVVYGLYSGAQSKAAKRAEDERDRAMAKRDKAVEELETAKVELYQLRAQRAYCEKHHDQPATRPA